jgi:glycosyltransferase involved in cell wall biosynthesis
MKLLVVVPYYHPYVGGLEIFARQLNIAMQTLQATEIVVVTSGEKKGIQVEMIDGMTVYRLGRWFKLSNTPFNPLWTRWIKRLIEKERPDAILAHAPVPTMAAATSRAKGDTPFIVVYHAATLYKKGKILFNIAAGAYLMLGKRLMQRADRIFAVSDYVKDNLRPELQAKTSIVPNAVWKREIVSKPQSDNNNFVFINSLNRSHAWKGLSMILEAVALYRQQMNDTITLTVLGDGDMRQEYEQQAARLGIADCVDFRGLTVGDAKEAALQQARALIMYPTTDNDAFPTVMLEAWSRSTPVIAAATGPLPSLITDGIDGLLCTARNPEALAAAFKRIMSMSKAERGRIASNAAHRTSQNYTWEKQALTVREHIEAIL